MVASLVLAGISFVSFDAATSKCRDENGAPANIVSNVPAPCVDLTGATLRGATLTRRDLRGARFDGVDLTGANLAGADLTGASFIGAVLDLADLRGTRLDDAVLDGASARRSHFEYASLERASLRRTELSFSCFYRASFRSADLRGARFATFPGALEAVSLNGALVDALTTLPLGDFPGLRRSPHGELASRPGGSSAGAHQPEATDDVSRTRAPSQTLLWLAIESPGLGEPEDP